MSEYQNQLKIIGAKKLYEASNSADIETVAIEIMAAVRVVGVFPEWEELTEATQQYWVDLYNAVASEIRRLSDHDVEKPLVDLKRIHQSVGELQGKTEELLRGQAALKMLKELHRNQSIVGGEENVVEDIVYGDVDDPRFTRWIDA